MKTEQNQLCFHYISKVMQAIPIITCIGMSLCDASSTLYSVVITKRLHEWVRLNASTGEFQTGFKRNYSTMDGSSVYIDDLCTKTLLLES